MVVIWYKCKADMNSDIHVQSFNVKLFRQSIFEFMPNGLKGSDLQSEDNRIRTLFASEEALKDLSYSSEALCNILKEKSYQRTLTLSEYHVLVSSNCETCIFPNLPWLLLSTFSFPISLSTFSILRLLNQLNDAVNGNTTQFSNVTTFEI